MGGTRLEWGGLASRWAHACRSLNMNDNESLCQELANAFPGIRVILDEHLADFDELLPHVFFGDLTRYVLSNGADKASIVQRLEDKLSTSSESVDELICVSFVENLETAEELEHALAGVSGNKLREEWWRQHPDADA